ncbi:MAG: hypothetical protein M3198_06420 [Actinomycetota bacterium]|nr:hypothetical protein [Actinomycetota bacterium]
MRRKPDPSVAEPAQRGFDDLLDRRGEGEADHQDDDGDKQLGQISKTPVIMSEMGLSPKTLKASCRTNKKTT